MLKIHRSIQAERDLINIWLYSLKNWGKRQADSYIDSLSAVFITIADNPKLGTTYDEVREGYRCHHWRRHLIFYRIDDTTLHIARVLGDEMDYEQHL